MKGKKVQILFAKSELAENVIPATVLGLQSKKEEYDEFIAVQAVWTQKLRGVWLHYIVDESSVHV